MFRYIKTYWNIFGHSFATGGPNDLTFWFKLIMRRTLAKGENYLIWEIMADLANRQLRGDQVVAIHLERRKYTTSVWGVLIEDNTWPVNTVQELLSTVMSFKLVLVSGSPPSWVPMGTAAPIGVFGCFSFGGWTFWRTFPSTPSAQSFDATCLKYYNSLT